MCRIGRLNSSIARGDADFVDAQKLRGDPAKGVEIFAKA